MMRKDGSQADRVVEEKLQALIEIISREIMFLPVPLAMSKIIALTASLAGAMLETGNTDLLSHIFTEWICRNHEDPPQCEEEALPVVKEIINAKDIETVKTAKKTLEYI